MPVVRISKVPHPFVEHCETSGGRGHQHFPADTESPPPDCLWTFSFTMNSVVRDKEDLAFPTAKQQLSCTDSESLCKRETLRSPSSSSSVWVPFPNFRCPPWFSCLRCHEQKCKPSRSPPPPHTPFQVTTTNRPSIPPPTPLSLPHPLPPPHPSHHVCLVSVPFLNVCPVKYTHSSDNRQDCPKCPSHVSRLPSVCAGHIHNVPPVEVLRRTEHESRSRSRWSVPVGSPVLR